MQSAAERFAALFPGFTKAHGVFVVKGRNERGKLVGRATTVQGAPDLSKHLSGEHGVGIIPLRDDDTLLWGAIDVDKYNLDITEVDDRVRTLGLPLLCCRSKSGGVHLYLFLKSPHEADAVRRRLEDWASRLGVGGSEIFPKQSYRSGPDDIGNWINMPYYAGTDRKCTREGRELELEEFIELAEAARVDLAALPSPEPDAIPEELQGAPPCLIRHALEGGAPDGHKHAALFGLITYCRKRWPEDWQQKVHDLNPYIFKPMLSVKDIETTIKSVGRKEYDYECNGPWCNKSKCKRAEFGRGHTSGGGGATCEIDHLVKIVGDPVYWIVEIEGKRVRCDTTKLQNQTLFGKLCMETVNRCPPQLPTPRWLAYLDGKLRSADVVESPVEVTMRGRIKDMLTVFLTAENRRALDRDELLLGKPMVEGDRALFRGSAFIEFLTDRRFGIESHHDVWCHVRDLGGKNVVVRVGRSAVRCWEFPLGALQDTGTDVEV